MEVRGGDAAGPAVGWGYRASPFQQMALGTFAITGATVQLAADPEALARLVRGSEEESLRPILSASRPKVTVRD